MTATASRSDTITVPSRLFGPIQVPRDSLLTFDEGLLGFGGERQFIMMPAAKPGLFWLQDAADAGVIFLLADPLLFFPDYAPPLDLPEEGEHGVLGIVTLGPKGEPCSINLQGPLVFDFAARRGTQVVLEHGPYGTRHEVDLAGLLAA